MEFETMSYDQIKSWQDEHYFGGRARKYREFLLRSQMMLTSADPKVVAARVKAGEAIIRTKYLSPGQVHVDTYMNNMSVMYANEEYIGGMLLPMVPVTQQSDLYPVWNKRDQLAYPSPIIGVKGTLNEINLTFSDGSYKTIDRGYKSYVPYTTNQNADQIFNLMVNYTRNLNEAIAFMRELDHATILTTSANYGSNTAAIAAANRWDTASGGKPIKNIQDAIAALWNGRGMTQIVGFTSYDVYNVLSRHPSILDLFKYNGSSPGLATPGMIAQFLGMDRLLVGKARKDTANEGQTASYPRIWSDVFGVIRVATAPAKETASFGYTFQFGPTESRQWYDMENGRNGGYYTKVTTSEDYKIVAADTGYLLTSVIN